MTIISRRRLRDFWEQHREAEGQLRAWHSSVEKKKWTTPNELKADYPLASIVANNRVVFNIVGNNYRLVVAIRYASNRSDGTVYIRWIGTHREYDRIDVETI